MTTATPISPLAERAGEAMTITQGTIVGRAGATWLVGAGATPVRGRVATSCLVAPELQDRVLVALGEEGDGWILAVLERPGEGPLVLGSARDVTVSSGGKLRLSSEGDIDVVAQGQTQLTTKGLGVTARVADLAVERVTAVGEVLEQHFSKLRTVTQQLDVVADRVVQRVKRRYQFVAEIDTLRAGHVDMRADETLSLRSEHTLVTAREVVKVDGDQVHVG